MIPSRFGSFFAFVLAAFLFTWLALVVAPWIELGHLAPIRDEATNDITPWDKPNEAHAGERVYAANGCAYCHTQQVRPATSGADLVRGWGTAHDEDNKEITRRTYPRDYLWDHQVFLGASHEGADLTNVGDRFPNAPELYRYLYDPAALHAHSSMPAYRFLFVQQKISGLPASNALVLTDADAPPAGYEILPTSQARALVAYLLSLKNDYHLPDEKGPGSTPDREAMSTQNPDLISPTPHSKNSTVQPNAPDFVEMPDVNVVPARDHEPLPIWLYVLCGFALFLAGSSFTGFGVNGLYDQGPGEPIVATGTGNAAVAPRDPMAIGKGVYGGNCANCHQATGEGQPGSYPPLVGSEWVLGDKAALYAIMLHGLQGPLTVKGGSYGTMQMPGWGTTLNDEKIADVMTYIRASWGNTADAVKPEEVTAARAKFAAKGDGAYTEPELLKISPNK